MNISQFDLQDGTAIIEQDRKYSYKDLSNEIRNISAQLDHEISERDVVCIKSDYSFKSIALLMALSQRKCIIVPVVPTTEAEFQSKIEASGVRKIISLNEGKLSIEKIENETSTSHPQYEEITENGACGLVLFSSGTTGVPKVMVHNFSELITGFKPPKKPRKLNFLLFLLFDHIGGLNTLLNCLNNGSEITLPSNRNPEYILGLIEKQKVQIFPTTPTFLNLMLMTENFEKHNLSSLKMITYGTERMPQTLLQKLKERMPHVKFLQTFGTSETGIMRTESKSSTSLYFKIVDPDYQYKIVDGQLFLKSCNQVNGYVNQDSEQFIEDNWFATGDLVETDQDGYIKIIGRINNVINVGGQKVLPKEVEDVILEIPNVIDVTVYSKTNAITGQMVCAEVVVPETIDSASMKTLIHKRCRAELDKYKVPSKISITHSMSFSSRFKKQNKN